MTAPDTIPAALVAELLKALVEATDFHRAESLGVARVDSSNRYATDEVHAGYVVRAEQARSVATTIRSVLGVRDAESLQNCVKWVIEELLNDAGHQHNELHRLRAQTADTAKAEPVVPNTGDQATALIEHLVNDHHVAPAGLDDIEGDLTALATFHGNDHAQRGVYDDLTHDLDDHQPVQDRAEELARQHAAETAEVAR